MVKGEKCSYRRTNKKLYRTTNKKDDLIINKVITAACERKMNNNADDAKVEVEITPKIVTVINEKMIISDYGVDANIFPLNDF